MRRSRRRALLPRVRSPFPRRIRRLANERRDGIPRWNVRSGCRWEIEGVSRDEVAGEFVSDSVVSDGEWGGAVSGYDCTAGAWKDDGDYD
mmetsp:Transcript_53317/g.64239  ORF Transcript_53317/g.64239 Transcript_53317/m.64239 type:complete len:90 (+) Transcript_53317:1046-1315(+)